MKFGFQNWCEYKSNDPHLCKYVQRHKNEYEEICVCPSVYKINYK